MSFIYKLITACDLSLRSLSLSLSACGGMSGGWGFGTATEIELDKLGAPMTPRIACQRLVGWQSLIHEIKQHPSLEFHAETATTQEVGCTCCRPC
jgi:hypothetical protein